MLSCALLFHCCLCRCYILCRLKLLSHTYCLHWWRIYRFIKSLDADVFSEQQARWRAHFNAVIILVYRCASYKAFVPVIVLFWLVDCTLHSSCTMWGCWFFFQLYSLLSIPRVVICSVFQTDLNYLKFPTSSLQFTDYVMQHCPLQACRVKTLMHKGENKPIKRNKTYLAGQARYVDGWQRWRNLESSTGTYLQIGVFIWIYDFPLFFGFFFHLRGLHTTLWLLSYAVGTHFTCMVWVHLSPQREGSLWISLKVFKKIIFIWGWTICILIGAVTAKMTMSPSIEHKQVNIRAAELLWECKLWNIFTLLYFTLFI